MNQENNDLPKISAPAQRALQNAGINSLEQLTKISEAELLQLHGMGPNAIGKLHQALAEHKLSFRDLKTNSIKPNLRELMNNVRSQDGQIQNSAYSELMTLTESPVDWAYEVWDELIEDLTDRDNHVRAISAQVLANLAKSDPAGRMFKDFNKLLAVTKDEKFVTARHCLQSIWKVGLAGRNAQQLVVKGLEKRFHECAVEKNCTLIRYDIIVDLHNLYHAATSSEIKEKALELIELEPDQKYRKKYAGVWRK